MALGQQLFHLQKGTQVIPQDCREPGVDALVSSCPTGQSPTEQTGETEKNTWPQRCCPEAGGRGILPKGAQPLQLLWMQPASFQQWVYLRGPGSSLTYSSQLAV